ncbi:hypothetical protein HA402_011216 [Bradysia odoriphaga]|nr:hypothetical protein HA402_011216 [Bradysia odoriphaga]
MVKLPITTVQGVLARQAMLPCDINPLERDDAVYMVLWFREGDGEPLYSFDVRGRQFNQAKFWSSPTVFGSRAFFSTSYHPAQLRVDNVRLSDEGMYRCRVDFRNSPTRNLKINLTVIVPPERPIIYKFNRREKLKNVEAYNEGTDVALICEVTGGRPPPNLTWYLDNSVIDESFENGPDGISVNRLTYPNIGRQHVNARFICMASNTNLTPPLTKVVILDVNCECNNFYVVFSGRFQNKNQITVKPQAVHILIKEKFVSADKSYDVECHSSGSKPPAILTWWKGGKQLKKLIKNFSEPPDNQSLSVLTFTASAVDDGKHLTCRAENSYISNSAVEDKWRLVVHYMPIVSLEMGPTLNPADIKEGDGVYFECEIKSNPKPYKMAWFHDGTELHQNVGGGIILTEQSLVLQSVTRSSAGDYTCLAANTEGRGTSNPVTLRVRYAPICTTFQNELLGALKHETLSLKCEVDASPPAESFHWTFNSSGEQTELPSRLHSRETGFSRLNYTPTTDLDYGTISCWGRNAIGLQRMPCTFQIVAAGKPFGLQNCTVFNQSSDSLQVECVEGFNGGLPQAFFLELIELSDLRLVRNLSIEHPPVVFFIDNLEPNYSYRIIMFAVNAKGRSEPTIIDDITFKGVATFTGQSNGLKIPLSPILASLTLIAAVLFAVVCIVLATLYRKYDSKNAEANLKSTKNHIQLPEKLSDCQLNPPVRDPSGTLKSNPANDLHRERPQFMELDDDTDPDVIPNQYERRPLKPQLPTPLFRSPSIRFIQRDTISDAPDSGSIRSNSRKLHHDKSQSSKQISYATLSRSGHKSITTCNPPGVTLHNTNIQLVTSSLCEYRLRPEVVTMSNRIQESCI